MMYQRQTGLPMIRPATKVVMGITLVVFILRFFLGQEGGKAFFDLFGLTFDGLLTGFIWQPVSYIFLHGGGFHLFWNMLLLFFFSAMAEEVFGRKRFLLFYLGCGVVAGLGWLLLSLVTGNTGLLIGGSGAIYGVLCAAGAMYPNQVVYLWFVIRVPLKYLVFGLMFLEFALTFDANAGASGVANSAHLFGGIAGYIYGLRFRQAAVLGLPVDDTWWKGNPFSNWKATRRRGRFQVMSGGDDKEPTAEDVDQILEKIHRSGYDSLTKKEQSILERASGKSD